MDLPDALAALQEAIGILDRSLGDEPDGTTFPNTSIGLAVHWYARVLDALGRNEEADLVRLRMHWEGGVRRRADALRTTPITLDQLARTMECPVDAARAEMARMVEFGYAVLTRPGPDGPVPVRPDTIADHARFSYEYTWPWQLDQDGPSGN